MEVNVRIWNKKEWYHSCLPKKKTDDVDAGMVSRSHPSPLSPARINIYTYTVHTLLVDIKKKITQQRRQYHIYKTKMLFFNDCYGFYVKMTDCHCYIVFLCTAETAWLDGKHCVFGKVTNGMDVVTAIEAVGSQSGKTSRKVMIADCGQL